MSIRPVDPKSWLRRGHRFMIEGREGVFQIEEAGAGMVIYARMQPNFYHVEPDSEEAKTVEEFFAMQIKRL